MSFAFDLIEFDAALKIEVQDIDTKRKEFEDGKNKLLEEIQAIEPLISDAQCVDQKKEMERRAYVAFIGYFKQFSVECSEKMLKYVKKLDDMKSDIKKVGEMFGENADYKTKDFLNGLITFATLVKTISV